MKNVNVKQYFFGTSNHSRPLRVSWQLQKQTRIRHLPSLIWCPLFRGSRSIALDSLSKKPLLLLDLNLKFTLADIWQPTRQRFPPNIETDVAWLSNELRSQKVLFFPWIVVLFKQVSWFVLQTFANLGFENISVRVKHVNRRQTKQVVSAICLSAGSSTSWIHYAKASERKPCIFLVTSYILRKDIVI